jgi:glutathione S-transferase
MASERVIYWGSGSTPAWRALVGLEEKGLEYTSKIIEFSKSTSQSSY